MEKNHLFCAGLSSSPCPLPSSTESTKPPMLMRQDSLHKPLPQADSYGHQLGRRKLISNFTCQFLFKSVINSLLFPPAQSKHLVSPKHAQNGKDKKDQSTLNRKSINKDAIIIGN